MNKKTYSIEISGVQNAQYAQRSIGNKCYHDFVGPDGFLARMEVVLEDLTVFHSIDARNVSRLFTINLNQEQDN